MGCIVESKGNGKLVLVTGATSGIGMAVAAQLLQGGWTVVCCGRRLKELDALPQDQGLIIRQPLDLMDSGSIAGCVAFVAQQEPHKLDLVVHCAGSGLVGRTTEEQINEYRQANVYGSQELILALMPHMKSGGRVAITTSMMGLLPWLPGCRQYIYAKRDLRVWAENHRAEWQNLGVSLTQIVPGFVKTKFYHHAVGFPKMLVWTGGPFWQIPANVCAREILQAIEAGATHCYPGTDAKLVDLLFGASTG